MTTSVAAAALLAGPAATWALDASGVTNTTSSATTQAVSTTQNVVSSTQQAATNTVSQVQSTAQTTVESTTQAAAPVTTAVQQAAAPVAPSAPSAPAAAPSAPSTSTRRPSAATPRTVSHVSRPAARVERATAVVTSGTTTVRQANGSVSRVGAAATGTVTGTTNRAGHAATRLHTSAPSAPAPVGAPSASACESGPLSLLQPLLGGNLSAVASLLCSAGDLLVLNPPHLGTGRDAGPGVDLRVGVNEVLGALVSGGPRPQAKFAAFHARAAHNGAGLAGGSRTPSSLSPARTTYAGAPASLAATAAALRGSAGALGSAAAVAGTSVPSAQAGAPSGHGNHGLFGTSITGTEALFALLIADWALLVALLTWRVARRRPLARLMWEMQVRRTTGQRTGNRRRALAAALSAVVR